MTVFLVWWLLPAFILGVFPPRTEDGKTAVIDLIVMGNMVVIPALVVWDVRRRRRIHEAATAPPGFCPSCGHDLRATPKRCPECGTVVGEHPRERDRW